MSENDAELEGLVLVRAAERTWVDRLAEKLRALQIFHRVALEASCGKSASRFEISRYQVWVRPDDLAGAQACDREVMRDELPELEGEVAPLTGDASACAACGSPVAESDSECPDCGLALINV